MQRQSFREVTSLISDEVARQLIGFGVSISPGNQPHVRTLLHRDPSHEEIQVGQPSLLPWPRALAG